MKYICINGFSSTAWNTTVTIISIICTFFSGIFALRTSKIKNSIINRFNAFDIATYSGDFHVLYVKIMSSIITSKSNKGGQYNGLIDELNAKLADFNKFEVKIPINNRRGLRANVDSVLSKNLSIYEGFADDKGVESWKERLKVIDRDLIEISEKMKNV